jgi:hypothetical protein
MTKKLDPARKRFNGVLRKLYGYRNQKKGPSLKARVRNPISGADFKFYRDYLSKLPELERYEIYYAYVLGLPEREVQRRLNEIAEKRAKLSPKMKKLIAALRRMPAGQPEDLIYK